MPQIDLFHLQCLTLTGPDARAFAQSQFTADLDALPEHHWTAAGWCDAKGRTLAVLLVAPVDDEIRLAIPDSMAGDVARRLSMFTIGRKVTISAPQPVAPAGPGRAGIPLAEDPARALAFGEPDDEAQWHRWLLDDALSGLAWILPATSGRFLPQMLGLEARGGLSYRKGCWPGQEVVARVHYRGRLTRASMTCEWEGPPGEPGDSIVVQGRAATLLYAVPRTSRGDIHAGVAVVDVESPETGPDPKV